jgi:DNA-binding XRE family transcriptional regulator
MSPEEYKSIREKLALTQAGLAARLGVTRKTINARETGATRIVKEAALAALALLVAMNDMNAK